MWKKKTSQRPSTILLVDSDEKAAADLAQQLGARGSRVFHTATAHVGRRLSQEYYFDLVIVDDRVDGETIPPLSKIIAADNHRCVILAVDHDFAAPDLGVAGALRRPLQADRVADLAAAVVRDGRFNGYCQYLDLLAPDGGSRP